VSTTGIAPAATPWSTYGLLTLAAVFWGGTFVAGRLVSAEIGPFSAAFVRFLLASLLLSGLLLRQGNGFGRLRPRQWGAVVVLGATGVFAYNVLFFNGLRTVEAGRAAVIIAGNPIFIALFSALIFGERLNLAKGIGIVLSVAGAVTVISRGDPLALAQGEVGYGELAILGCVASWVAYTLLGKRVMSGLSALEAVSYSCMAGTVLLLLPAWHEGLGAALARLSTTGWGALFYLAFFGTVLGFVWFYQGVRTIGPARAGVFINFVPISAVIAGGLLLGEPVTLSLLVGGGLVLGGLFLANRFG
jgi:drug/metabolite transporter (DMT)-like permease